MAELKTKPTSASVDAFLQDIDDPVKKEDSLKLVDVMSKITGADPVLWGSSIVGFGNYHYTYKSGREGDWFHVGFSPRKRALTLYIMSGFQMHEELLESLGKYKTGKGCLYIRKLDDVDMDVLSSLIKASVDKVSFPPNQ